METTLQTSILLAKFWGYFVIAFGLVFLIRPTALNKLFEYVADEKFMFMIGFISFIIGLVNILLHNIWVADWRTIITFFGWIAVLKGISRIGLVPGITRYVQKMNVVGLRWSLLLILAIGAYLLYCAYHL